MLSMLGRQCKLTNFSQQVSNYFWQIVSNSEPYNEETLDRCVNKFSEMVKYQSMGLKKPFFGKLAEFMRRSSNDRPTIPLLRLF